MAAHASSETLRVPEVEHNSRKRSYSSAVKRKLIILLLGLGSVNRVLVGTRSQGAIRIVSEGVRVQQAGRHQSQRR